MERLNNGKDRLFDGKSKRKIFHNHEILYDYYRCVGG